MKYYTRPQTPPERLYQVASVGFVVMAMLNLFDVFGDGFTPVLLLGLLAINVGREPHAKNRLSPLGA